MILDADKDKLRVIILEIGNLFPEIYNVLGFLRIDMGVVLDGYFFPSVELFLEGKSIDHFFYIFLHLTDQKFKKR